MSHEPITTLADLDALDMAECVAGYRETNRGDPEPGPNHSRSYHHGWRTRLMDLGEIEIPPEHRRVVHEMVTRDRGGCLIQERGAACMWCQAGQPLRRCA